jgi:hypothetical protein
MRRKAARVQDLHAKLEVLCKPPGYWTSSLFVHPCIFRRICQTAVDSELVKDRERLLEFPIITNTQLKGLCSLLYCSCTK